MFHTGKKSPLPGLELTPDVILSTDAAGRQAARRAAGLELAEALLDGPLEWVNTADGPAVLNIDTGELVEDRSAAFAALLAFAADESNHVAGLLDDGAGGTFHAGSALWKSSLRLDPNWMEVMRRRSRGRAHHAMRRMMASLTKEEKLARHYGWRQRLTLKLITLTMPHLTGATSLDETKRINQALTLLKKRGLWVDAMAGGVKGVEDALDFDGPHVHAHMLMLSSYLDRPQLVEAWRECLDLATRKLYGFGLAEDCPVIVDVRAIKKKPNGRPDAISWEDALAEVTKYVTKPSDYLKADPQGRKIPRSVLLELCEVRRWPRMFELLGRCREPRTASQASERPNAAQAALDSIRRAYLTGEVIKVPAGIGWELVESWCFTTDGPEALRKSIVHALKEREKKKPDRVRPPSWRDLLDQISLSEWLGIMAERFRRGKTFRIGMILDANPNAYLVSFSGKTYGFAPEGTVIA
jgi:hypothetical protein